MKQLLWNAALLALLVSCNDTKGSKTTGKPDHQGPEKSEMTKECYRGVLQKDIFKLDINIVGDEVRSGKLIYNFFEKDRNEGHVSGKIYGDTILLDYAFMSEGKMSRREVAFLKKGNTVTEGFGDVVQDSLGNTRFKDRSSLTFDSKVILKGYDCN